MPTLNQIADRILGILNEPFDIALREQIKFSIKYYRATLIRRDFERNAASRHFAQSMTMKLIKVDKADTCVIDVGCKVLRSENKVPNPVRIKGESFRYVGSPNRDVPAFTETDQTELRYTAENRFTKDVVRFNWINGYIYVYPFGKKFKYVTIEAAFEDPEAALELCVNSGNCTTDDEPFPIAMDMVETIIKQVVKEYPMIHDDQEVKIEDDSKTRK